MSAEIKMKVMDWDILGVAGCSGSQKHRSGQWLAE